MLHADAKARIRRALFREVSMRLSKPLFAGLALSALIVGQAAAADKLTLYCSADEAWCQLMARGFEEETGHRDGWLSPLIILRTAFPLLGFVRFLPGYRYRFYV